METDETPKYVHVICGWPLVLVFMGGAIGGGLGGAAYGLNHYIYGKTKSVPITLVASLISGACAFVLWLVIASQFVKPQGK